MNFYVNFIVFINEVASLSKQLTTKSPTIRPDMAAEVTESERVSALLRTSRVQSTRPESHKTKLTEDTSDINHQV